MSFCYAEINKEIVPANICVYTDTKIGFFSKRALACKNIKISNSYKNFSNHPTFRICYVSIEIDADKGGKVR